MHELGYILLCLLLSGISQVYSDENDLITCHKCIVNPTEKIRRECTTCNGTACYVLQYNFTYPQYKGLRAFEQDCIVTPAAGYPTGCRSNRDGNILCICQEELCNTVISPSESSPTPLAELSCMNTLLGTMEPENPISNCTHHQCIVKMGGYMGTIYSCPETNGLSIAQFDVLYLVDGNIPIPADCCVYIESSDYSYEESCSSKKIIKKGSTDIHNIPKKNKCLAFDNPDYPPTREITCTGELCFAATNRADKIYFGCISQFEAEGVVLQPGQYVFGNDRMFICDTEMCNKFLDSSGNERIPFDFTNNGALTSLSSNLDCSCLSSAEQLHFPFSILFVLLITLN